LGTAQGAWQKLDFCKKSNIIIVQNIKKSYYTFESFHPEKTKKGGQPSALTDLLIPDS
jgi:hypothetical protein